MSNITIEKIAFVTYLVKDLNKSRDFYEKLLGLKPGIHTKEYVEYDLPKGGCFTIASNREFIGIDTTVFGNVAFEVNDLHSLAKKLKENNIKFKFNDIIETPVCYMLLIYDIDNNAILMHQLKNK